MNRFSPIAPHPAEKYINRGKIRGCFFFAMMFMAALLITSCASTPEGRLKQFGRVMFSPAGDAIVSSIESIEEATEEITPENEYYIGRSVAATITSKWPVYRNAPETTAYLNAICGAITLNSDMPYLYRNYCVAILDTDEINAMATPGGHIFISRGLIRAVDSEDALAAVIAHEIAHIQLKHSISAIKASRITGAATQAVRASAMASVVLLNDTLDEKGYGFSDEKMERILEATETFSSITEEITEKLVNSGFSKSQEFEADEMALSLMADAGYNPHAMLEMLEMIPSGSNHGWGATHPEPEERIKKVSKELDGMNVSRISSSARKARTARFEANIHV